MNSSLGSRKETKLPIHWSSKVPKSYKRNAIIGELNRAKKISDNFENEIKLTRMKFKKAGYPSRFVESIIKSFLEPKEEFIIPPNLFKDRVTINVQIPYSTQNEKIQHQFTKKFHDFTNNKYIIRIIWKTRKIKSLFHLKDKNVYPVSYLSWGGYV